MNVKDRRLSRAGDGAALARQPPGGNEHEGSAPFPGAQGYSRRHVTLGAAETLEVPFAGRYSVRARFVERGGEAPRGGDRDRRGRGAPPLPRTAPTPIGAPRAAQGAGETGDVFPLRACPDSAG